MIKANEARKLVEMNCQDSLRFYVERTYGENIQAAAESHSTHIIKYERRPYEAVKEIADYLKEYGYNVVIKKVTNPLWMVEVYW